MAVLEKRMKEDRVRPEKVNFSAVIHVLGKAGQPRKAFEIFKKVNHLRLPMVPEKCYFSLFDHYCR